MDDTTVSLEQFMDISRKFDELLEAHMVTLDRERRVWELLGYVGERMRRLEEENVQLQSIVSYAGKQLTRVRRN
jgi:hypothetical protein